MKLQVNPIKIVSVHRLKPEYAFQIWQIFSQLSKNNYKALMDAIRDVESNNGEAIDFEYLVDELREVFIDFVEECGSCGCRH